MANAIISVQDQKLLELAANNKSPEEMQAITGVPAAEALVRIRRILASKDVLEVVEKRQLLMDSAYRLKEKLEENLDPTKPKEVEAVLKTLTLLDKMLTTQGKISDAELEVVSRAQAKAIMQMIEAGYEHARRLLETEYGHVLGEDALTRVDEAFMVGLRQAQMESTEN